MNNDPLNPDPQSADEAIKATIEELEKPQAPETPAPEATDDAPEEVEQQDTEDTTPEPDSKVEAKQDEGDESDDDEVEQQEDYKEKFSNSSREAAILNAKLKKSNEALVQAGLLPKPTEEEMREEYPEWDEMSVTERRLATNDVWNTKRFDLIESVSKETKDVEAWNGKVDTFVEDPKTLIKYPRLEGKTEGFKAFCVKETRRGVDFEDLVSAFLFKVDSDRKPKKGQMFEKPSGGDNTTPKPVSKKLSVEESAKLMETDYNKWQEMLSKGLLDDGSSSL